MLSLKKEKNLKNLFKDVLKFLQILEKDPCENVVAFTHNGMLGFMLQLVLGVKFSRTAVKSANCAIQVFEYDGRQWKLLAWNYMSDIS